MSESQVVQLDIIEQCAWVRICRPETLNALDQEVLLALREVFLELQERCNGEKGYQECRSVVLCSEGDKSFVAGADIKMMESANRSKLQAFIALGQGVMNEIEKTPLPVIAMIQGFAIGGGLELALACDIIVASTKAKMGQAEVSLGLIPGFGGTQRLAARCGIGTAKRLVMTGETIYAKEAYRLGIVDYLAEPNELTNTTVDLCKTLSRQGPLAVAAAKKTIDAFVKDQKGKGLSTEIDAFVEVFDTRDAKKGLTAFLNKKSVEFEGN